MSGRVNGTLLISAKSSPNWNVVVTFRTTRNGCLPALTSFKKLHIADRDRLEIELAEISK
jgi:hypothetical protein